MSPSNEYSGLISLLSKGLSRVFSSTISIVILLVSECMCPLYNPVCGSLSDQILKTGFSPVIILLKPSEAPIALEKKSHLLESKGLLHLVPPSVWPLMSTIPHPFWPAQHPPCPGTRRILSVALLILFCPWRAAHNLPLSLYLSKRCLAKLGPSTSFFCYICHLLFVSRMASRFHYMPDPSNWKYGESWELIPAQREQVLWATVVSAKGARGRSDRISVTYLPSISLTAFLDLWCPIQ